MNNTEESNTDHRQVSDKLLNKIRDSQGKETMDLIANYHAFLKTWQERIGVEQFLANPSPASDQSYSPIVELTK